MTFGHHELNEHHIEMINNIPSYYHVNIFLNINIFGIGGTKWPIHVIEYKEHDWPPAIYEIQNKYIHPIHNCITLLVNRETYQPYSFSKSAIK